MRWYVACLAVAAALYLMHRGLVETIGVMRRLSRILPLAGRQWKPDASQSIGGLGMLIPAFEATEVLTGRTFDATSILGRSVTLVFIRESQLRAASGNALSRFLDQCWLRSEDKVYVFLVDAVDDNSGHVLRQEFSHWHLDGLDHRDDFVLARSGKVSLATKLNVQQTPWAVHVDNGGLVDQIGALLDGKQPSREFGTKLNGHLG